MLDFTLFGYLLDDLVMADRTRRFVPATVPIFFCGFGFFLFVKVQLVYIGLKRLKSTEENESVLMAHRSNW